MPTTSSDKETADFGKKISLLLKGGDILCLYGDLGAGKTTLVKGIAAGLGIKKNITSPTFALMNFYPVKCPSGAISPKAKLFNRVKALIHIDTYRLKNEQELIDIGAEDYLGAPDTVCIIEWSEKIENLLRGKKIQKINIEHVDEKMRKITYKN